MSKWIIDASHSSANFKVEHLGIAFVRGSFFHIEGEIETEKGKESIKGSVNSESISTGNAYRDTHLKSEDFFDTANFPQIEFSTTSLKESSPNTFDATIELKIKNIAKTLAVKVSKLGETTKTNMDGSTSEVISFQSNFKFDRREFGLNWNMDMPGGKFVVGNEVEMEILIEAIKA